MLRPGKVLCPHGCKEFHRALTEANLLKKLSEFQVGR